MKKKVKQAIAMALAAGMIMASAACGGQSSSGGSGTTATDSGASNSSTAAADSGSTDNATEDSGAADVATVDSGAETLEPVTLHFYFFDNKKSATDQVWDAISEKYKDQLNAKFDVQFIAGTDYKDKLLVKAAAGDKWDMNFDGEWSAFFSMIAKDAYMELDDLLPVYAPDLYAAYQSAGVLDSARNKGKIVALPWTMSMTFRPLFQWRGDLAESAGLGVDASSITTIEDVDALLYKLKEAYPGKKIIENSGQETFQVRDNIYKLPHNFAINLDDPECKIFAYEDSQAYRDMAKYAKKWQDDGLIWKDVLTDNLDHNTLIDQGELITKWGTHEFANSNRSWVEPGAYWASNALYEDNLWPVRTPLANVAAIPRTSENPERTLMFMNLLETDRELYDMMHYGIEGVTYELNGEEAVYPDGMNQANSSYMDWGGRWAYWKPQFMRPDSVYKENFWVEEAEFVKSHSSNIISPLEGFNFDAEPVKTEIAQRTQVYDDAHKLIEVGLAGDPDKAVDNLSAQLKASGEDAIMAEYQRQIDEFLASKK